MCGRFSRPKKIGKRSSASLFFTLQAIYCLQGQYLTGLALQPIPERPPVRQAHSYGKWRGRPRLWRRQAAALDCLDCLGKAVSPVSGKEDNSLSL